jgi:hypothetical protein
MSFTEALERVVVLARDYNRVTAKISAMAVAADHDHNWGAADDAELGGEYRRQAELVQLLGVELAAITKDHATAFEAFLALGVTRLSALTKSKEWNWTRGEYERDEWQRWVTGTLPVAERPVIFARGIADLEDHRAAIDRVLSA